MANKIVELEQKKDSELEELDSRLREKASATQRENELLRTQLAKVVPELAQLRKDFRYAREHSLPVLRTTLRAGNVTVSV